MSTELKGTTMAPLDGAARELRRGVPWWRRHHLTLDPLYGIAGGWSWT
jgi:hypothetical protein